MPTRIVREAKYRDLYCSCRPKVSWITARMLSMPYSSGKDLEVRSIQYKVEEEYEKDQRHLFPCKKAIYGWITIVPGLYSDDDDLEDFEKCEERFLNKHTPFDVHISKNDQTEKLLGICLTESIGFGVYKFVAQTLVGKIEWR